MPEFTTDIAIVGAGHNGLVAATFLARAGLKVVVLEEKSSVGGAAKTEFPFPKAPKLGTSTGAYLLGVMQPELIAKLGAKFKLIRRDPHYFLPTLDRRYLLFGSNQAAMQRQFLQFFSKQDWAANEAMNREIGQIRDDLAPAWLAEPMSVEATAERYIRPGMGMNFLVHNMCRLPASDGTWMIVEGGMGSVTQELARLAREAGAEILTGAAVDKINVDGGSVGGVVLKDGREISAKVVLSNADPFRTRAMVGAENFPTAFNAMIDNFRRTGTTMKVNLALDRLPTFKCLPEGRGQHNATIHLLPQEKDVIGHIRSGFEKVQKGELAEFPTIEWYIHTQADPTLQDDRGRHNSAFFIQWVPYELSGGKKWANEEARYVDHLLNIADQFAPGFKNSVVDVFPLTPKKIEQHFGITFGHIHHVDNTFGFDQRMPYAM